MGYDINRISDGMAELAQRWKDGLSWKTLDVAKDYAAGRLAVAVHFQSHAGAKPEIGSGIGYAYILHREKDRPVTRPDQHTWDMRDAECWSKGSVLLRIVEFRQPVERFPLPGRKDFKSCEGRYYDLRGCYYSFAGGFKIDPVAAGREAEIAVLCAAIPRDHLSSHVVKGGPEVVDSVAYCQSDLARHLAVERDFQPWPTIAVMLRSDGVALVFDQRSELPVKIADVLIGPFDL
ncbi:MAG: hypothetical protein KIT20_15020 [Alphaproteobacteria bacterium]|nr:hypothetical protein [Alphaproteobacteria bacterium]